MSCENIIAMLGAEPKPRLVIAAHHRPDGDAIGTVIGFARLLRHAGFDARPVALAPIPHEYAFIAAGEEILLPRENETDWIDDRDWLAILDCGEWSRLEPVVQAAKGRLKILNIDHHASSTGLGDISWVEDSASSTGEMIVRLAAKAGWEMPAPAAMALWTAIVTDTGRFSYENATAAALKAAAVCVENGAIPDVASKNIYQSVSRETRFLQHRALRRLEFHEGGRLGVTWLTRQDFLESGIGAEGTQDMINLVRDTAGVEVALFLYEMASHSSGGVATAVKTGIRTVSPHDALVLSGLFGGGGHRRAAGCTVSLSMATARRKIVTAARRLYFRYRGDTMEL